LRVLNIGWYSVSRDAGIHETEWASTETGGDFRNKNFAKKFQELLFRRSILFSRTSERDLDFVDGNSWTCATINVPNMDTVKYMKKGSIRLNIANRMNK